MIAVAAFLIVKTELMLSWFGRSAWAEEKLGGDGTRVMYKIIGMGVIVLAFMIMSGKIVTLLDFVFDRGI